MILILRSKLKKIIQHCLVVFQKMSISSPPKTKTVKWNSLSHELYFECLYFSPPPFWIFRCSFYCSSFLQSRASTFVAQINFMHCGKWLVGIMPIWYFIIKAKRLGQILTPPEICKLNPHQPFNAKSYLFFHRTCWSSTQAAFWHPFLFYFVLHYHIGHNKSSKAMKWSKTDYWRF